MRQQQEMTATFQHLQICANVNVVLICEVMRSVCEWHVNRTKTKPIALVKSCHFSKLFFPGKSYQN